MRAFISYSLNDSEQYVLSILARKLKEQGFIVSSSYDMLGGTSDFNAQLSRSSLFIGIITATGNDTSRVFNEWLAALNKRIPALLLIEDNVAVKPELQTHPNIIRFNRSSPEQAMGFVKQRTISSMRVIPEKTSQDNDNTVAWILGGLAILAIIALLAKED